MSARTSLACLCALLLFLAEGLHRSAAALLETWAEKIRGLGAEVKGPWLVDFDSGAGYYCWKWPEEGLGFFHGYEEGFSGRVRLQ